jgi:hypothetical protein
VKKDAALPLIALILWQSAIVALRLWGRMTKEATLNASRARHRGTRCCRRAGRERMGKRGPKRIPTLLKELHGNPGKCAPPFDEPQGVGDLWGPPVWFDDEQREQ